MMTGKQEKNKRCPLCGGHLKPGQATVPFLFKKAVILVNKVPAEICTHCHEPYMTGKVTDRINDLLHPLRDSQAEILTLSYTEIQPDEYSYLDRRDFTDKHKVALTPKFAEGREAYVHDQGGDVETFIADSDE